MALRLGTTPVVDLKVGATAAVKAYLGAVVVWQAGFAQTWTRSIGFVAVTATSHTWTATLHQTWVASAGTATVTGASGAWMPAQAWTRSDATLAVTATSGTWGPLQAWTRSDATLTVTATSGAWAASLHQTWVATPATVAVAATSGAWMPAQTWTRSDATATVTATSGAWAPLLAWTRSDGAVTVTATSGVWGPLQAWTRSDATVTVAATSGEWTAALAWTRSDATVTVTATSGIWLADPGFTPNDVSGLVGWFDANDTASFEFDADPRPMVWNSQVGTAQTGQSTASLRPVRATMPNGRQYLRFNTPGVHSWFNGSAYPSPNTVSTSTMTICILCRKDANNFYGRVLSFQDSDAFLDYDNAGSCTLRSDGPTNRFPGVDRTAIGVIMDTEQNVGVWCNTAVTYSGTNITLYNNGDTFGPVANTGTFDIDWLSIADHPNESEPLPCSVCEVVVYNRVLTSTELADVAEYLDDKWLIATVPDAPVLIAAHPGGTQVTLDWTVPLDGLSPITHYVVEMSSDGVAWSVVEPSVVDSTVVISGLTTGLLRYFRVAAVNAVGAGAWSNVMSATPGTQSVLYLQSNSGEGTNDFGVAYSTNLTADSLLVASCLARSTTAPATISDTGGHTWTLQGSHGPVGGVDAYLWVWTAPNAAAGACTVNVNYTPTAGGFGQMTVVETTGAVLEDVAITFNLDAAGPTDAITAAGIGLAFVHDLGNDSTIMTSPDPTIVFNTGGGGLRRCFGYRQLSIGETMSTTAISHGSHSTLCAVAALIPSAPVAQTWTRSLGTLAVAAASGSWLTSAGPPTIATTNTEIGTSMGAQPIVAPTGIAAGDLLLAFAAHDNSGTAMTASAGWTLIQETSNAAAVRLGVWARIATATGADALTITGTTQDYCASMLRLTGHGVNTIATDIKSAVANAASGNADPPSLDTGSVRSWLYLAAAAVDLTTAQTITAMPSGYTQAHAALASASSTSSVALGVAYLASTTQTADPPAFTNPTQEWAAVTLAIPPVPTAGPQDWTATPATVAVAATSGGWSVAGGGGFVPTDIAALAGWYDASDAASFTFSSGAVISQWNDKSGAGHHLVQATGAGTAPQRTGTLNSLSTVVWSGTNWALGTSGYSPPAQPYTVFIVGRMISTSWAGFMSTPVMIRRQGSDGNLGFDAGGTAASYALDTTNHHRITAVFNGATSKQRIDGVEVGTTNTGSGSFATYRFGADSAPNHANCHIAEICIYEAALTAPQIAQVESYLATRWGL